MSAHTPGPWNLLPEECDRPYVRVRGTVPGGRFKIANVLTPAYEGVHEREAKETRANARLIAAAPELLAALKLMLKGTDEDCGRIQCPHKSAVTAAFSAIAKAEGRE